MGLVNSIPQVKEDSKDDNTTAPPQFSPPVPLDDGSEPEVMVQSGAQTDSENRPIDHPPTLNGHLSTDVTATTEALVPTSGCHIPQADIGEAASSLVEIEEVPRPSTPSNNDE